MARLSVLFVLLFCVFASHAAAQDSCGNASACCNAAATAMHRPPSMCASLAHASAQACDQARGSFAQMLTMMHQPVPASCGAAPPTGGGGGDPGSTPPVPPGPGDPPGPPGGGPSGGGEASPPPTPLPPEAGTTVHASGGLLACIMERDPSTNGHRVLLGGMTTRFTVKCSGIPSRSNPSGNGAPVLPPTQTAAGQPVVITWRGPPAGELSPLFANAVYTAPATAPSPAEMRISATVTIGSESVTVFRTVHVVSRHLRLAMSARIVNHCHALDQGSVNVGFEMSCDLSIQLNASDDYSVTGSGGTSCGTANVASQELCAPQLETSANPEPGWSFDGATGQIDPDTGILSLQLSGNRVSGLTVHFVGGRSQTVHAVPLFPRPFTMGSDDGATRSFGSMTTNSTAGGISAFTIHSH